MNAVETLEAAITKLEELRKASTPGPWIYGGQGWLFGSKNYTDDALSDLFGQVNHVEEDGILIVTLHRTIDAQLAILREAHDRPGWENGELAHAPHAVNLAHAILGDS